MNTILKHDEKIQDPQSHDTRQHKNSSGKMKENLRLLQEVILYPFMEVGGKMGVLLLDY
jgi:hypothetical protein